MFELSLHILDLVQNSVRAGAKVVFIRVIYNLEKDELTIELQDDGCGMSPELLERVSSPFATTRTTRKVGLGIPMFKQLAEGCEGAFFLDSTVGQGTTLRASFRISNIDLPPLGDLAGTMGTLILGAPQEPEFVLEYQKGNGSFCFDTRQIRQVLGGVSLAEPDVLAWIQSYIGEGMAEADQEA